MPSCSGESVCPRASVTIALSSFQQDCPYSDSTACPALHGLQALRENHVALEKKAEQSQQNGGEDVTAGAAGGSSLLTSFGWAVSSLGLGGSKKVWSLIGGRLVVAAG